MMEIKMVCLQTRECIEGDAGEVVRGYYTVTDGTLTMCNEEGRSTGKTCKLNAGDDERRIVTRLLRQEMLKQPASNFHRKISYQKLGVA
jgi:hypothetical protein